MPCFLPCLPLPARLGGWLAGVHSWARALGRAVGPSQMPTSPPRAGGQGESVAVAAV